MRNPLPLEEIAEVSACRLAMIDPIGDHAQGEMMPVLRARAHPAARVRSILP